MSINAHGDKDDIIDSDFPIPQSNEWNISTTLDSIDVDTYDIIAHKLFKANENIPNNFKINNQKNHPFLKHDINVNYQNWVLYKNYSINIKFLSRNVDEKYPRFMEVINDPEALTVGWAEQVFSYLFKETLHRTSIGFNQKGMIEKDLNAWLQREISTKTDSTIIEQFDDLKEECLDLMMHPINPSFYNEIDSIFNYLEQEYKTTQLLIDDEFEVKLYIPGILKMSNHEDNNADTLIWKFHLRDFMDTDYEIYVNSQIYYKERTIIALIISFIVALILLIKRRK